MLNFTVILLLKQMNHRFFEMKDLDGKIIGEETSLTKAIP
jgi:hypothetical protein